jgi:hypothetical protein
VRPKKLDELSGQERKVIEALRKIKSGKLRDQLAAAVRAIADEQQKQKG